MHILWGVLALAAGPMAVSASEAIAPVTPPSQGAYRLPFADHTQVKVFDDARSHRPIGRLDLFGVGSDKPHRLVAAAAGRVVAIQDGFSEQQSGRAAKDCHNNYVWIAHPNGEWTNYSHLIQGTATGLSHLHVGDAVAAGQLLGYEGAVGCAMLDHVHFEVAVPLAGHEIDEGGFLTDNEGGKRERDPRFCGVDGGSAKKDATYVALPC
jgi:murein DD-endopeptidase MepM/ murein hydrolase activator NlpD